MERERARHSAVQNRRLRAASVVSINFIMAIVGFVVGVSLAAGSLVLATNNARGRVYRDVLHRPLV